MKIIWVDDEILRLKLSAAVVRLRGHDLQTFDRTDAFLRWLKEHGPTDVDVFIVDLMMVIDDESLAELKPFETEYGSNADTGVLLIGATRKSYPRTPIIVLTNVGNPPMNLFADDELIDFVQKSATMAPVLEKADQLMQKI